MPKPRPIRGTVVVCQMCAATWSRLNNLGKPKWCSQRCADLGKYGATRDCNRCGKSYYGVGKQFCSQDCARVTGPGQGPSVGRAYRAEDWTALLGLIRASVVVDEQTGCWMWAGRLDRSGYAIARGTDGGYRVHRLALEATNRTYLGSQTAHHKCAIRACVNPDHLEPVTHAENVGEMLARRAYRARIGELEEALAALDPVHPLLDRIRVK